MILNTVESRDLVLVFVRRLIMKALAETRRNVLKRTFSVTPEKSDVMHLYHFVWITLFFCSTQLVSKVKDGYQGKMDS